jgi:hypothetical protein
MQTDGGGSEHAEPFHVPAAVVVEPVNGAARIVECRLGRTSIRLIMTAWRRQQTLRDFGSLP